jgi:threonine aldolase
MRKAMAEAEVGDDVFGEDPTVIELEDIAADRLSKEAALFVASGTMGNLVSLLTHCGRGDEIILGDHCHSYIYEQGGSAAVGGIHPMPIKNRPDGTLALDEVEKAIRSDNVHFPRTKLLMLENTHNRCNGGPVDVAYMYAVGRLARRCGLKVHVDGARIFHASIALGLEARDLVSDADSVCFCLSKGLGAPVGSVLCGDKDFILEARRNRKLLGGGMRQAGVLAAAGIVALTKNVDRLAEDHATAWLLAMGLANTRGLTVDLEAIRTNIVYFRITRNDVTPQKLAQKLDENGVRLFAIDSRQLRAVTHYHINSEDIEYALGVINRVLKEI